MKPVHALWCMMALLSSGCVERIPFALLGPDGDRPWVFTHRIKNGREERGSQFGAAVALTNRYLFVGAPGSDQCGPRDEILEDCPGKGILTAWWRPLEARDSPTVLTSTSPDLTGLGTDIAATPGQVWVGASGGGSPPRPGRVLEFRRSGQVWSDPDELRSSPEQTRPKSFGTRVALAPPWGAAFAPEEPCPDGSGDRGVVYAYSNATGTWVHHETLCTPLGVARDGILVTGKWGDVLIEGNLLFVGLAVSRDTDASGRNVGRVRVFRLEPDGVEYVQELRPNVDSATAPDDFGAALAAEAGRLYVGAPGEGAVYVFEPSGDGWDQVRRLNEDDGRARRFGESIAISEGQLLVGAPRDPNCATGIDPYEWSEGCGSPGAAFLYVSNPQFELRLRHYIKPTLEAGSARFGASVAISKATLAVGAPIENHLGVGVDPAPSPSNAAYGAVYLFERNDG